MADEGVAKLQEFIDKQISKNLNSSLKSSLKSLGLVNKEIAALQRGLLDYNSVLKRVEQQEKRLSNQRDEAIKQQKAYNQYTKEIEQAISQVTKQNKILAKHHLTTAKASLKSLGLVNEEYKSMSDMISTTINKVEKLGDSKENVVALTSDIKDLSLAVSDLPSHYDDIIDKTNEQTEAMHKNQKILMDDLYIQKDVIEEAGRLVGKYQSENVQNIIEVAENIGKENAVLQINNEVSLLRNKIAEKFNPLLEDSVYNSSEAVTELISLSQQTERYNKALKIINASLDANGKSTLSMAEAMKAVSIMEDRASENGKRFGKVHDFLANRTKMMTTAGGLAWLTWHNWTKKVQQSTDLWIDNAVRLPKSFSDGMKQTISRTFDMSAAMTKVDIAAIRLGMDVDVARDNFHYLAKTLKLEDAEQIAKLTVDVTALSRIMGSDYYKTIDSVATKVKKMGQTSAEATDNLSYMYEEITELNEAAGVNIIQLEDVADMMNDATISSTAYAQNSKMMTGAVNQSIITLQKQGLSYRQAADGAKTLLNLFENAPDWMQWRAGGLITRAIRLDPKVLEQAKREVPSLAGEIEELSKGGAASQRMLFGVLKGTTSGMKAMTAEATRLAKIGDLGHASFILMSQGIAKSEAEAVAFTTLLRDIDSAGGLENFSKGLDKNYEKAKQLYSLYGVGGIAEGLKISKQQAEELAAAFKLGPEEGEKAYAKYLRSINISIIKDKEATKQAISKQKGFGAATKTLVADVQKGLTATSLMSGKLFEGAVKIIEDNPILTGMAALFTGGIALMKTKPKGKITPDTEAITGGSSLARIERAIYMTNALDKAGGIKGLFKGLGGIKDIPNLIKTGLGKIPGIGKPGLIPKAGGVGLLSGAGLLGVGASIGGGLLASYGISKIRKEDEKEKSRRELGGAIGTGAGAIIGTLLGGPIGIAIGGAVGGAIGSLIGKFLPELKQGAKSFWDWITNTASLTWAGISGGAIQIWDNLKKMFSDIPTSLKTIVMDGILSPFTSIFDMIKNLIQGDFKAALIDAATALIPFGRGIKHATKNVITASAEAVVAKEKELSASEAAKKAEEERKKKEEEERRKKAEDGAKKKKYSGFRSSQYYKRFVVGERINRDIELNRYSPIEHKKDIPEPTPIPVPIADRKPAPFRPVAVPPATKPNHVYNSNKNTILAKAVGMQGNKAVLEILNFDTLIANSNKNINQATF